MVVAEHIMMVAIMVKVVMRRRLPITTRSAIMSMVVVIKLAQLG